MQPCDHRARGRLTLILALMLVLAFAGVGPIARAQADVRYFSQTGHYLRGAFRYFWEANGGVAAFGYPVTEEYRRASDGRIVQFFERARFELTQQGTQYTANLGNLGVEITGGKVFPKVPPIPANPNRRYFPQTQHVVQYGFKTVWESGGERVFGQPISEEIKEVIDDGEWHTVQYFEKARFEFWPNYAPGKRVLISALGRKLAPPQLLPPLPPNAPPPGPLPEGNAPPAAPPPPSPAQVPASVNATVSPTSGPPGTTFAFAAYGFDPGESVGIWLTAPNQATFGADFQADADASGSIANANIGITTDRSFDEGVWSFNAQGVRSKRQAVGYFLISSATRAAPGNPANLGTPIHDQLPTQGSALIVPVAGPGGTTFTFQGGGFRSGESVSVWLTDAAKKSTPLPADQVRQQGGVVLAQFSSAGLADGVYTIVAQGDESDVVAAANFKLTDEFVAPPGTPRPASVNGSVTPAEGGGDTVFQLRGQGFQPNERLQYWSTAPDGTYVLYPDEIAADAQGRIGYNPPLDLYGTGETLPGVYGFHFRGKSGGARVDLYLTFTGK